MKRIVLKYFLFINQILKLEYISGLDNTDSEAVYVSSTSHGPEEAYAMNTETHKWLDNAFKKAWGDNVRTKGLLWCFKRREEPYDLGYGKTYVVYPKDGFRVYYTNKVGDVHEYVSFTNYIKSIKDDDILAGLFVYLLQVERPSAIERNSKYFKNVLNLLKDNFGPYDYKNKMKYIKFIESNYPKASEEFIKYYFEKAGSINDIKKAPNDYEIMIVSKGYYLLEI